MVGEVTNNQSPVSEVGLREKFDFWKVTAVSSLAVAMVKELQSDGVEPDIWKIEGLENAGDYKKLVKQMRSGGRDRVQAIVLGRGADGFQVEKWLKAGADVDGIIGFAIGRTIFWQPLVDYKENKINREEAASQISQNYHHFYQIFNG